MIQSKPGHIERLSSLSRQLVDCVSDIKVLSRLSWPAQVQNEFLDAWRRGSPQLPQVDYQIESMTPRMQVLQSILVQLDRSDPIEHYLRETAESYMLLCRLLERAGKPGITEVSRQLYGQPQDRITGSNLTSLDAAYHFIDVSHSFHRQKFDDELADRIPPEQVAEQLRQRIATVITEHPVAVVIDENLASKAAAGASRIRLRGSASFSMYDLEQLLQHEAFVHSLTAINGYAQPVLNSLGLSAPRTTGIQEGLATFAELVSGAIDLVRLNRIALRVVAIEMALQGANFLDVFKFFLDAGQPEFESFNSTMRVFRGAPTSGGSAFTKDTVYMRGLMEVNTFFHWAFNNQRFNLCQYLFAGRMTIDDVRQLEPMFQSGCLVPPLYLPPWMGKTHALAAYLAFNVLAQEIRIDGLDYFEGSTDR